jgi:hypothetical protein
MPVRQLRRLEPRFDDLGLGQAFLDRLASGESESHVGHCSVLAAAPVGGRRDLCPAGCDVALPAQFVLLNRRELLRLALASSLLSLKVMDGGRDCVPIEISRRAPIGEAHFEAAGTGNSGHSRVSNQADFHTLWLWHRRWKRGAYRMKNAT